MFTYSLRQEGPTTTVLFTGDLDIEATETMEEQLERELCEYHRVELDFSNVPFVDSSGIGLLLSFINKVRENGKEIVVINVTEDVQMVFSLLQLQDIVGEDVFADLKQN